jgi:hypothetical protein
MAALAERAAARESEKILAVNSTDAIDARKALSKANWL